MSTRNSIRFLRAGFLVALLGGCTVVHQGDVDDVTAPLEDELGGPEGLMEFFSTAPIDDIRAVLARHGMGYIVHEVVDRESSYIGDCPQYFPSADRNSWHDFNGEHYYIDSSGRPYKAYAYLPPIASERRWTGCQGDVGQWGDAENPSDDYDGGHMIGSQLGGWGKRANLIPQDTNFNRGNWKAIENKMAKCDDLPDERMFYYVRANYSNSGDLVPSTMNMLLENRSTGDDVWLTFDNEYLGGSSGPSEKNRAVDVLDDEGCN